MTSKRSRSRGQGRRVALFAGVAVAAVGALAAASFLLVKQRDHLPRPGELAVLDGETLERTLAARGVPHDETVDPFAVGDDLKKLIADAGSSGEPRAKIKGIVAALSNKLDKVRADLRGHGREAVRTADELAADLLAGKAQRATSYELAVLLTASLRYRGLAALLCEVYQVEAPTPSADVTGVLGRFIVSVYRADKLGRESIAELDAARATDLPAWAGSRDRPMVSKAKAPEPLDDATAAAFLLSQRALRAVQLQADAPDRAYELSELAIKAGGQRPTLVAARALVLAQTGGVADAVNTARKALALRDDAPRRIVLAQLLAAKRDVPGATKQLAVAIKRWPKFWPAHQQTAALRWMLGDREGGDKALAKALALAPNASSVKLLQAAQMTMNGKKQQALELLRKLAKHEPTEQVLLQLYSSLIREGESQEAKKVRKQLMTSSGDNKKLAALLDQMVVANDSGGMAAGGAGDPVAGSGRTAGAGGSGLRGAMPMPGKGQGFKLPDVDLSKPDPSGLPGGGFKLPDVKLTP